MSQNVTDKKIAVFDLDDTLINVKAAMYTILQREYGSERVPHWSLWDGFNLEKLLGVSFEEFVDVCIKHQTFRIARPHLFAPYILKSLRARGWHVVILSAREGFIPNAYTETEAYLELNDMQYDELLISKVGENKMDSLEHHDKMVFTIDDNVHNCDNFRASEKFEHVFLHAQTYNRDNTDYVRIHNLFQIYYYIGIG